ncbi:MAG: efflux RND transporter permease subunit [Desulfosalsimonadaceae bacterium]
MNWIGSYLNRPHAISALLFFGVIFGVFSLRGLPLNLFPDANYPQVSVLMVWPGASADDMTDRVSRKAEKALAAIDEVRRVRASVRDETAALSVEFEYEKGFDAAVTDVSAALDRIAPQFPEGMRSPAIFRITDAASPVLTLAASPAPGSLLDMAKVRQLCDNEVREAFLRLDDVADVEVFGGYVPEIQVVVDRRQAAAYGFFFEDIVSAIGASHRNLPGGTLVRKENELLIRVVGEKDFRHELGRIVVGTDPGGGEILLDDIAEIRTAFEERKNFYHGNGKPAIGLNILRSENGNVMDTLEAVEAALPDIDAAFPGLSFEIADTQGDLIATSVSNLFSALRSAILLTVGVIFFFLARMRITLLAAVSIPFTFLLTFAGMRILGFELNIVTMTAVILAVGLLVDDAVVVIENIDRRWRERPLDTGDARPGRERHRQSVIEGTGQIFPASLAGTITTIAVLIPIIFVGGYAGKILGPLATVLSMALLASFVSSVTIIPLLAQYLLKPASKTNRVERFVEKTQDFLIEPLSRFMIQLFRMGTTKAFFVMLPVLLVLLVIGLRQIPMAGRNLMPPMDTGIIKVSFETWPNTSVAKTEAALDTLQGRILEMPGFIRSSTAVGSEPGVISFGSENTPQEGLMTIHFVNRFEREASIWDIRKQLQSVFEAVPAFKTVHIFEYGATPLSAIAAPVDVMISGPDPQILDRLADEVKDRLHRVKGLTTVSKSWDMSKREIIVDIDEKSARRHGITYRQAADTLYGATTGRVAANFKVRGQDGYPVRVQLGDGSPSDPGALGSLEIPTPRGIVYLSDIAQIRQSHRQTRITREGLQPTINVIGYREKAPISYLDDQVKDVLSDMDLPAGYDITQQGEVTHMNETFSRLGAALGLALLLLYFALVVAFRSWANPVMIMSAIPLAFIGIPWGMMLAGQTFSMAANMGMILMSGIVVNNSILLVEFIDTARRGGSGLFEAVEEAIRLRTRPILMTAFSTIAGMLPIALELAVGLERLSPLAVVAITGLIVSTFLTLAYVPAMYVWIARLKARVHAAG